MAKNRYECTYPEYHADDDWIEIEAYTAEGAARHFAERMDESDPELFLRPDKDAIKVKVRPLGGESETFSVNFDYVKQWYVHRVETV